MSTRKEILEQLAQGEIDASQAAELLNAVPDAAQADPPPAAEQAPTPDADSSAQEQNGRRWLRIHISNLETGRSRVRVNVPLGLVQFGLKVGARFTDEVDSDLMRNVMDVLHDTDITGTLVEVEDVEDNERVHIFVE
ncbi:MAG: hypothetical protein JXA10_20135 [Anaerolineae bacterium]|nr:hypothetical protein [Anaerolineae bacterium]